MMLFMESGVVMAVLDEFSEEAKCWRPRIQAKNTQLGYHIKMH